MRILIFHGYLLAGTGSNVYNARLAEALARMGHEVHLLSQDRHAEQHEFVDALAEWDAGTLRERALGRERDPGEGSCTAYRPEVGGLLPVYVADRYEGVEARPFAACSDEEIARYIERNVAAVAEVKARVHPRLALANHLVMGPVILARSLAGEVPYAVKVHGSALEYTVKPQPQRFLPYAREGLEPARGVLVGSRHTAASLWQALGDASLPARTRLGPPGVDVRRFAPLEPEAATRALRELANGLTARADAGGPTAGADAAATRGEGAFARDAQAAGAALARLRPGHDRLVAFVGKLIASKGVDLAIAAWPLVLAREPRSRLVVVGFGSFREGLEALVSALGSARLQEALELARRGRALEEGGGRPRPLRHLVRFLEGLEGEERERYATAAAGLAERVVFTGRLEHEELASVLPACEALVVPSTFPEAFGMVAAEAAACGALPISAAHSGLAEVSEALARAVPPEAAGLLSFALEGDVVRTLAARVCGWLAADEAVRRRARTGLVEAVREQWSWEGVARGVLDAAQGRLDGLRSP